MPFLFRSRFLIIFLLIVLSACGVRQLAQGDIQPPQVTMQGLMVGRPSSQGWPVGVTLLLTNPNPQPLELKGYDYEFWLEGNRVAQGASEAPVHLPARGQTVTQFPILVQLPALMRLLPMLLQPSPPALRYQMAGGFRLGSVLGGLIRVPFRFQGQVTPQEGLDFLRPYLR